MFYFYVCRCSACVSHPCTTHARRPEEGVEGDESGTCCEPRRAGAGNQTLSSARADSALNRWPIISLAPGRNILNQVVKVASWHDVCKRKHF